MDLDETGHVISLGQFENKKKYKAQIVQEIVVAVCAMLNSNGGNVTIYFETSGNDIPVDGSPFSRISLVKRILEQSIISLIGTHQTVSKINLKEGEDKESMVIQVRKADYFITTNFNLYLPSETQVVQLTALEPLEKVKSDVINRKVVLNPVKRGSYKKNSSKGKSCGWQESKTDQRKYLKATSSKRTRLADRMTGKGNKLACYVSAFANHSGGHIYYGITDDGVVEGEFIPNEKDKTEIIKKVVKAIDKMIWPEQIGQPKRGEHWEIFFEPVVDENSKPVPSTFVIVIYIAPCLGGVFTEEPECYEMVEGKVKKMSFVAWKKGISQPVWLRGKKEIAPLVPRVTWSSNGIRKAFIVGCETLRRLISNGDWNAISRECRVLSEKADSPEMKLIVFSKQITASNRRGYFNKARSLLNQYKTILPQVQDILIFEVIGLHLEAALARAIGDSAALKKHLTAALSNAELIEPGLVTAIVYVFAATVTDLVNFEENFPSDNLSLRALEHLLNVPDMSEVLIDMKRKAHINLATFYLGCNISGQLMKDNTDVSDIDKAEKSIMAVQESLCQGNPLKTYHEVQLDLVLSINNYRHSQANRSEKANFLKNAFNHAEKAECLAREHQFRELVEWSQVNKRLCTEGLIRAALNCN